MFEDKPWLTCREAAQLLNYSQRHIVNLIKNGKLSAEKDEDGKYYIQKAEFFRVYPTAMPKEMGGTAEKLTGTDAVKFLEEKVRHLQEMLDERRKQNDLLVQQLNNFTEEKSKMLDAIASHTRLLEHKKRNPHISGKKPFSLWPFKRR